MSIFLLTHTQKLDYSL
ncbi:hypothetical protein CGLO_12580 [Colletotrichum gloeosporioides Cg-14]|uniref:Uncharacterized protein n=1 Tax=Colletotrichum gloeosporioides (strain Cg-14) TaxID=1237896 RepID=T0LJ88_COLGC|nr:hypothetical protein CGLO_12580 [Colletotrichum gloeosporioides Cg-14]